MKTQPSYRYANGIRKQVEAWLLHQEVIQKSILDCRPGELLVWPTRLISEVCSVTRMGNSYVSLLQREEDGKLYPRKLRIDRLMSVVVLKEGA